MDYAVLDPPTFHVHNTGAFAHYDTISSLWEHEWKGPCEQSIYPFWGGRLEDFEPIIAKLIELSGDDVKILYDPDSYAAPFIPVAQELMVQATAVEGPDGDKDKAKELYLRAAAVCCIARFPIIRSEKGALAWAINKEAASRGGRYLDPPLREVSMAFSHADIASGDSTDDIPAYLRLPNGRAPVWGWPIVLFVCGLDSYRTESLLQVQGLLDAGFAVLSFEIPGTGDCPASRSDPRSPDRLMSSVIDWVHAHATEYNFNPNKICARGISTGSYYVMRMAHTHADRLCAAVAHGGGAHYMFHPSWIESQDRMEYPFALAEALACKFGHDSVAAFVASEPMKRYGLLTPEIVGRQRPSCKMLVLNGVEDSVFPIEDSVLFALTGPNKTLLARADLGHMGNPGADEIVVRWLVDNVGSQ